MNNITNNHGNRYEYFEAYHGNYESSIYCIKCD